MSIAIFRVSKTESRRLRFFATVPDMRTWLNNHPNRGDPEGPLWISDKASGRPPGRNMIYHLVRNWGKSVLGRHVKPHMLRHTRFTHLSGTLIDRVLKELGGWSTTKMLETYSHLSGKDVDQSVLAAHGIKVGEELTKPILEVIKCPSCQGENVSTAIYCQQCGKPLATPAMQELMAGRDKEIQQLRRELAELKAFKENIEGQIAPQLEAWRRVMSELERDIQIEISKQLKKPIDHPDVKAERKKREKLAEEYLKKKYRRELERLYPRDNAETNIKKKSSEVRRKAEHNGGKPFESRIVSEDELTAHLDEGWDLVKKLCNGKI